MQIGDIYKSEDEIQARKDEIAQRELRGYESLKNFLNKDKPKELVRLEEKYNEVQSLGLKYNCNHLYHLATTIKYQIDNKLY